MSIRALLFEDDESIRDLLTRLLEGRGYEVVAFSEPRHCGVYDEGPCSCPSGIVCGDLLLTDLEMPGVDGLQVVSDQIDKGCGIPSGNIAVMSGGWNTERLARAEALGARVFRKPFRFDELGAWLDECEARVRCSRGLRDRGVFERVG